MSFFAPHLIPKKMGILFGLGICKHHPLYMQSIPKTARLSDITNEVGFWQACRSATALGKSEGNGARGDAATTPDGSNHGAAAIRKLGRRLCKSTSNAARRHTPRDGKETGVQNVDIITEESALIRLLTPKAGWDGE
ncbi:uncharacterized protein FTJAE_3407 [Fusarium tjaetaba]|uniref:Uncharacterized protein n=1 Tax=Fusarium tjaetaba TaxID=1567544 RepID=A0A8H5W2A7_9HYPO|nr:uncharacterized protein FTJAE_3407 [Fusarium tjaetaba]KAF5642965.1 hypothetical protein FTJAE_3407 [Fusarium tjaetaba]